ncbi:MAG: hypothetical protein EOO88_41225 [Pedobacter sp.]|nr:MAG: hypothetical protein EOO88_41225 [Pedobacter sp.]
MNKFKAEKIINDRFRNGLSIRNLAMKYGASISSIHRIVKNHRSSHQEKPLQEELPDDVAMLKALLRKERLKNELLNNIIDIADQELGTNIRKKSGTGQSE